MTITVNISYRTSMKIFAQNNARWNLVNANY